MLPSNTPCFLNVFRREARSGLERAESDLLACRLGFTGRSEGCHAGRRWGLWPTFHMSDARWKFIFGLVTAQHCSWAVRWRGGHAVQQVSRGGVIPTPHSNRSGGWCCRQGRLPILSQFCHAASFWTHVCSPVPWLLCPVVLLECQELEFLTATPLRSTERFQRVQKAPKCGLLEEKQRDAKLAVLLCPRWGVTLQSKVLKGLCSPLVWGSVGSCFLTAGFYSVM